MIRQSTGLFHASFGDYTASYRIILYICSLQFKKGDIFFNYGCFPQTWEDPTFVHPDADGCRGDNDPLDVVEIGARIIRPGVRGSLVISSPL